MPLPGYTRLPGKANRYQAPSGETISRRQYENLRFQKEGWKSWSEYQRTAKTKEYRRFVGNAKDENIERNPKAPGSEFNQRYLAARDSGWSKDPDGDFADFLVWLGVRRPDATHDVGDTP